MKTYTVKEFEALTRAQRRDLWRLAGDYVFTAACGAFWCATVALLIIGVCAIVEGWL